MVPFDVNLFTYRACVQKFVFSGRCLEIVGLWKTSHHYLEFANLPTTEHRTKSKASFFPGIFKCVTLTKSLFIYKYFQIMIRFLLQTGNGGVTSSLGSCLKSKNNIILQWARRLRHVSIISKLLQRFRLFEMFFWLEWQCDSHTQGGSIGVGETGGVCSKSCQQNGQTRNQSYCSTIKS